MLSPSAEKEAAEIVERAKSLEATVKAEVRRIARELEKL